MALNVLTEDDLKLAVYYANRQEQVSRAVNIGYIMMANICNLNKQRDTEK